MDLARSKKRKRDLKRLAANKASVISTGSEGKIERESWKNKVEFLMTVIGYAVGLGNMWRFPYLCYKNGGGAFLIPYFITMIFAGIPMFFMELALGQMLSIGMLGVFVICPIFKGIGYASMIMCFWVNSYYIVIIAWAFLYMFYSFDSDVPWKGCNKTWNSYYCNDQKGNIKCVNDYCMFKGKNVSANLLRTPVREFWELNILHVTEKIEHMGTIRWDLALCLLLSWILCYLCIFKGVAWTGKIAYFTALSPYVCIFCLLIRGATLPGAIDGIKFYVTPDFKRLLDSRIWMDAVTQIFYSYGIGFGSLMALGSYNRFHNNIMKDAIIISVINSGTSILSGFMIFSIIGYMAHVFKQPVASVAASGPGLAFLAYPQAVAEIPVSPLWSVLFFLMIIIVGLDSQFCCVLGFYQAFVDNWKELQPWRKLFLLCICIAHFFFGLLFVAEGGMYVFQLFDAYPASGYTLLTLMFFECITVAYFYGMNRFYDALAQMIGRRPSFWWKITWYAATPFICVSIAVYSFVIWSPVKYLDYDYPVWAHVIGFCLSFSSIVWIPGYAIYIWCITKGDRKSKLANLVFVTDTVEELREKTLEMKVTDLPKPAPAGQA